MMFRSLMIVTAAGLLSVSCVAQQFGRPSNQRGVHIALPDQAAVKYAHVRLGDIANITTSDAALKRRVSELEVAEFGQGQQVALVKLARISILLRLNGVPAGSLTIDGPKAVQVEFAPPASLTDVDVENAATQTFLELIGGEAKDLRVRLNGPFMVSLGADVRDRRGLRVEVLPPGEPRLGRLSTAVRLWDGSRIVASRPATFEVQKRQKVAVVLTSLRRDDTVTARNVRLENRFVSKFQDQPSEEDILGKSTRRDLRPGQLLSLSDLKTPPRQTSVIAVRARETIEVEAVSGVLRVRLQAATALQTGRVGDIIQFKNPDSGHTRAGRIVGPGRVQIKL